MTLIRPSAMSARVQWDRWECPFCSTANGPISDGYCDVCANEQTGGRTKVLRLVVAGAERKRVIARLVEIADALDQEAIARTAETLRRAAAVLDVEEEPS